MTAAAEVIRRCRAEVRAALYITVAERELNKLSAIHKGQPPQGSHARKAK